MPNRAEAEKSRDVPVEVRLMTVDPGHFHAALLQKEMVPGASPRVDVYGPLGADLVAHLARLASFNSRPDDPTSWEAEVHAGPDFLERMARERPGNVVVLAGRNRRKIEYIVRSIELGLHVLADKPWIVNSADLPLLERALREASRTGVLAYDIMTERYEITNLLQKELVNDPAIVGSILPGSVSEPSVRMSSVHHILKTVAGEPLKRPVWFFDPLEQGEPLADVGTHLVDLSIWTLHPDRQLDPRRDVELISATTWPTPMSRAQFKAVTGESGFPWFMNDWVRDDGVHPPLNQRIHYTLGGTHVELDILWDAESPHGDTHDAIYRGERASVEVRQGAEESWIPELYVIPTENSEASSVAAATRDRIAALWEEWPGLGVEERDSRLRIIIPEEYRVGHERHFAEVAGRFLHYLRDPASLPAWENSTMLVRYYITTHGTDLARSAL